MATKRTPSPLPVLTKQPPILSIISSILYCYMKLSIIYYLVVIIFYYTIVFMLYTVPFLAIYALYTRCDHPASSFGQLILSIPKSEFPKIYLTAIHPL